MVRQRPTYSLAIPDLQRTSPNTSRSSCVGCGADNYSVIMVVWGREVKKSYLAELISHRATKPQRGKGVLLSELLRGFVPSCEAGCVFLFACGGAETLSTRGCRPYLPANRLRVSVPARARIPFPLRVSCAVCGLAFALLPFLPSFLYPFPF